LGLLQAAGRPGVWKHGDPEGLELHDIQFMLCELQKVLQTSNAVHRVREYSGSCLRSHLLLSQGFSRSKCLDWLENTLLLFPTARTQETATQALASWLRLPGNQVDFNEQWKTLRHGDCIRFSLHPDGAYLEITGQRAALVVTAACHSVQKKKRPSEQSSLLTVERADGAGEIRYGDQIFLRTCWGAHIGPASQSAHDHPILTAPRNSERYEDVRRFWFERGRQQRQQIKRASVVCDGDSAHLCCLYPCAGQESAFVQVEASKMGVERKCVLKKASIGPNTCLQALRVERDQGPVITAQHLRETVTEAIQLGIKQGRLRLGQHDGLELTEPEAVRRSLLGCRAKWPRGVFQLPNDCEG